MNGTTLYSLGKIPVHLQVVCYEYDDELHIYPNFSEVLLSWEACKGLGILPDHYPKPISHHKSVNQLINFNPINTVPTSSLFTFDNILKEFPSVFDEQISAMTGEEFHIHLTQDTKPFYVNTPWSIPFAYCDKLKTELELLQQQNIIASIMVTT